MSMAPLQSSKSVPSQATAPATAQHLRLHGMRILLLCVVQLGQLLVLFAKLLQLQPLLDGVHLGLVDDGLQ